MWPQYDEISCNPNGSSKETNQLLGKWKISAGLSGRVADCCRASRSQKKVQKVVLAQAPICFMWLLRYYSATL